jgi:metal-sulfur cluster biosynthetic enzyme
VTVSFSRRASGGRASGTGGTCPPSPLAPAPPEAVASAALEALATVRDPELDTPITALGFVASCQVSGRGRAVVRLRLPTFYCAPNFSYLMAADSYDAVMSVPGITEAEVLLEDHFAADEINAGVAAQAGFVAAFNGEAAGELADLRAQFLRKAVMAGTDQVCRPLVDAGATPAELVNLTLGAIPATRELDRLRQRRQDLGLPADNSSFLLLDPATGERIPEPSVPLHLRKARVTQASIEANASICTGMFKARYPEHHP